MSSQIDFFLLGIENCRREIIVVYQDISTLSFLIMNTTLNTILAINVSAQWKAGKASLGPSISILRALPVKGHEAIGPFVFFDHLGPMPPASQELGAHPHAGIEVITYLIEGKNNHRDSAGNSGVVSSGGAQWMTAGRGILHAESLGDPVAPIFHAVQLWTRLPERLENSEPRYRAVKADEVPEIKIEGNTLRLLAGEFSSVTEKLGPIQLAQPALLLHLKLAPGAMMTLPLPQEFELGAYVLAGSVQMGHSKARLARGEMVLLSKGNSLQLQNPSETETCDLLFLGGEPAERPLVFHGSFVFNSLAKAKQAERDYFDGKMGELD